MKTYHAHIYYDSTTCPEVQDIQFKAMNLDSGIFKFHKLYPHQVGPHFLPMIELHFNHNHKEEVIEWISRHRNNFSVLIHEETGDDIKDHLSPFWLGKELPIDFTFFAKIQKDPSISVH